MSRKITLTLEKILEGKVATRPQAVGVMEVVPLLPQDDTHHSRVFAIPSREMFLSGNPEYGTIIVKNTAASRPLIVPSNTAWVTRYFAQDHALCKAGLLEANSSGKYEDAACVQSSQGGAIPADLHMFQILPATLRRMDKKLAETKSYEKLWGNIAALNKSLGVTSEVAHLEYLFAQFNNELLQFVAEFETVPGQIGALIIINGKLVGVEIAPSSEYWDSVWEPLIRFCYGPEALLAARNLGPEGVRSAVTSRPRLQLDHIATIDDIEGALQTLRKEESSAAERVVRDNLQTALAFEVENEIKVADSRGETAVYTMASAYDAFLGQVVVDYDYVVYASLVNSEKVPKRPVRKLFRFLSGE